MEEFVELVKEYFTSVFNVNVFAGIVSFIAVMVLEVIYMNKRPYINKKVEKAKQLGNVITAKRVKTWTDDRHGTSLNSWVYGTYEYEVDGRSYCYRYMSRQFAPATLTLYYINTPRRVFTGDKRRTALTSLLFYLLPTAAAVLVINLLGGV